MAFQRDIPAIDERFETILAHAVTQVKTEEDPLVLNKYKKLFKKNVPLTLRSYVAAYVVKQLACGDSLSNVHTGGKGAAKAPVRFGRSQYTGEPKTKKHQKRDPFPPFTAYRSRSCGGCGYFYQYRAQQRRVSARSYCLDMSKRRA